MTGTADPYQRIVRSAKRTTSTGVPSNRDNADGNQSDADRCKSPTSEQVIFLTLMLFQFNQNIE
jgi:hypothetical protein